MKEAKNNKFICKKFRQNSKWSEKERKNLGEQIKKNNDDIIYHHFARLDHIIQHVPAVGAGEGCFFCDEKLEAERLPFSLEAERSPFSLEAEVGISLDEVGLVNESAAAFCGFRGAEYFVSLFAAFGADGGG